MIEQSNFRPVVDDPAVMRELVAKHVDEDMPDEQLYAHILSLGVEVPEDVKGRDKRNLFAVLYTDETRQVGALVWD